MAQTLYYNELTKQLFIGDCSNGIMECVTLYPTIDSTTFHINEYKQLCIYDPTLKEYTPVLGSDGLPVNLQGDNGADGVDGITPQLKIVSDTIYASYDLGKSWTSVGSVSGIIGVGASLVANSNNYPDSTFTDPSNGQACATEYRMKERDYVISSDTSTIWIWAGSSIGFVNGGVIGGKDGKDGQGIYTLTAAQVTDLISRLNKSGDTELKTITAYTLEGALQKRLDKKYSLLTQIALESVFGSFFSNHNINGAIVIDGILYSFKQYEESKAYITNRHDLNGADGKDGEDGKGIYIPTDELIGSITDEETLLWRMYDAAGFTALTNKDDLVALFKDYSRLSDTEKEDFRRQLMLFLSNENLVGHIIIGNTLFILDFNSNPGAILGYCDLNAVPSDYEDLKGRVTALENKAVTFITDSLMGDGTVPGQLIWHINEAGIRTVTSAEDVMSLFDDYLAGEIPGKDAEDLKSALDDFARVCGITGSIIINGMRYTLDCSTPGKVGILQKDDIYYTLITKLSELEGRVAALESI